MMPLILTGALFFASCGKEAAESVSTDPADTITESISEVGGEITESVAEEEPEKIEAELIYVNIGSFEQDNIESNGPESIRWIVVKTEPGKALIITDKIIDTRPYNKGFGDVSWKDSSVRKYLNGEFYENAFTDEEKGKILSTVTEYKTAEETDENGVTKTVVTDEAETEDRVFLLSVEELKDIIKDFSGEEYENIVISRAEATKYAISTGTFTVTKDYLETLAPEERDKFIENAGWWWLRSTGGKDTKASDVSADGTIREYGHFLGESHDGLRPAMWITYTD